MTIHPSIRGCSRSRLTPAHRRTTVRREQRQCSPSISVVALLGICAVVFVIGCQKGTPRAAISTELDTATNDAVPGAGLADERVATLHVRGMSCPLCANNIDRQLLKIPGVERVAVNLGNGEVRVRLATSPRPTKDQLVQAIERSGFTLAGIDMPKPEGP